MNYKITFVFLLFINSLFLHFMIDHHKNSYNLDLSDRTQLNHHLPEVTEQNTLDVGNNIMLADRPIFHANRRPFKLIKKEQPPTQKPRKRTPSKPNHLSLVGIIYKPNGNSTVLFKEKGTNKRVKIKKGETNKGWSVQTITRDSVVLFNQENAYTFYLRKKK